MRDKVCSLGTILLVSIALVAAAVAQEVQISFQGVVQEVITLSKNENPYVPTHVDSRFALRVLITSIAPGSKCF